MILKKSLVKSPVYWRDCSSGVKYVPNLDCPYWEGIDKEYLNQHYTDYGFVFIRND